MSRGSGFVDDSVLQVLRCADAIHRAYEFPHTFPGLLLNFVEGTRNTRFHRGPDVIYIRGQPFERSAMRSEASHGSISERWPSGDGTPHYPAQKKRRPHWLQQARARESNGARN